MKLKSVGAVALALAMIPGLVFGQSSTTKTAKPMAHKKPHVSAPAKSKVASGKHMMKKSMKSMAKKSKKKS